MIAAVLAGCVVLTIAATPTSLLGRRRPTHETTDDLFRVRVGPVVAQRASAALARFRRAERIEPSAIASWADDLARNLRRGATLHDSLTSVIPQNAALATATSDLRHSLSRGATVTAAGDEWHERLAGATGARGGELLLTVASVMSVSAALGGPTAAPLDRVAVAMRQHASDDLDRAAQSAQAHTSARVLTLLPMSVLALLILTDADVRSIITEPFGAAMVTTGFVLNMIGGVWMNWIVGGRT
jgi:Flp pilus assembly protein TadB